MFDSTGMSRQGFTNTSIFNYSESIDIRRMYSANCVSPVSSQMQIEN